MPRHYFISMQYVSKYSSPLHVLLLFNHNILLSLFQDRLRYPSLQSFKNELKASGHFILLAQDKSKKIIGFVHYRFCKYKLEDTRGTQPNDANSKNLYGMGSTAATIKKGNAWEPALYLENLQTIAWNRSNAAKDDILTDIPSLMLTALALEHARLSAFYGIVKTTIKFVEFFSAFFRMSEIVQSGSIDEPTRYLAFDLHHCSFRYAFLLMREKIDALSGKNESKEREVMINHRVIARVLNPCMEMKSTQDPETDLRGGRHNNAEKISHGTTQKSVKVKVDGSLDLTEKNTSELKSNLGFEKMEILRSYSLPRENETEWNQQNDKVLLELQNLQSTLKTVEDELRPTIKHLFMSVYNEREFHESERASRERNELIQVREAYDAIIERVRSEQLAWEKQQEEDDNAVCDICHDGESVPDNRIIFCDSCNVCVHQRCYGVEKVPTEAWYCHACLYFKRDSAEARSERKRYPRSPPKPLPIDCELCPRKQGAFKQTEVKKCHILDKSNNIKWAHVLCAKWQGFSFVEGSKNSIIEDVSGSKAAFRLNGYKCCLCEGMRGTYNKCRVKNCNNWMHVTCARSSGLCDIKHGEDHSGLLLEDGVWSLACPEHSNIEAGYVPNGHRTIEQLKEMSKALPDDPMPEPPPKPFHKMSSAERKKYLGNPGHEADFCEQVLKRLKGRCEVCDKPGDANYPLLKCQSCDCVVHKQCYTGDWISTKDKKSDKIIELCGRCNYIKVQQSSPTYRRPSCHMCNQNAGTLIKARANPMGKKKWKQKGSKFSQSLFGHQIWVHPICGM